MRENAIQTSAMPGSTEVEISSNRENKSETGAVEDKQLPDMKISETGEKAKTSFIPEPTKTLYPDASYAPIKNNTGLIGRIYQMWGSQKTVEVKKKHLVQHQRQILILHINHLYHLSHRD